MMRKAKSSLNGSKALVTARKLVATKVLVATNKFAAAQAIADFFVRPESFEILSYYAFAKYVTLTTFRLALRYKMPLQT